MANHNRMVDWYEWSTETVHVVEKEMVFTEGVVISSEGNLLAYMVYETMHKCREIR